MEMRNMKAYIYVEKGRELGVPEKTVYSDKAGKEPCLIKPFKVFYAKKEDEPLFDHNPRYIECPGGMAPTGDELAKAIEHKKAAYEVWRTGPGKVVPFRYDPKASTEAATPPKAKTPKKEGDK